MDIFTVDGSSASLKAAANLLLIAIPVDELAGDVERTTGGVVSGVAAVVKLQE